MVTLDVTERGRRTFDVRVTVAVTVAVTVLKLAVPVLAGLRANWPTTATFDVLITW